MFSRSPQNSCHSFLSIDIIKAWKHHLPHNSAPSVIGSLPRSIQVHYSYRLTQDSPKCHKKKTFRKTQAISQWRRRQSTNSPLFLHIQQLSTTMSCRFLRLSMVRILPKVADQAKQTPSKEPQSTKDSSKGKESHCYKPRYCKKI